MESDDDFHSLSHSRTASLGADPNFLPTYEPEPLIGAHQPRQELIVDEVGRGKLHKRRSCVVLGSNVFCIQPPGEL